MPRRPIGKRARAWVFWNALYKHQVLLVCGPAADASRAARSVGVLDAPLAALQTGGFGEDCGASHNGRFIGAQHDRYGLLPAIWFPARPSHRTVAHEAFHATFYVLSAKGLTLTPDSEEAFAYYLDWLIGEIEARVR